MQAVVNSVSMILKLRQDDSEMSRPVFCLWLALGNKQGRIDWDLAKAGPEESYWSRQVPKRGRQHVALHQCRCLPTSRLLSLLQHKRKENLKKGLHYSMKEVYTCNTEREEVPPWTSRGTGFSLFRHSVDRQIHYRPEAVRKTAPGEGKKLEVAEDGEAGTGPVAE